MEQQQEGLWTPCFGIYFLWMASAHIWEMEGPNSKPLSARPWAEIWTKVFYPLVECPNPWLWDTHHPFCWSCFSLYLLHGLIAVKVCALTTKILCKMGAAPFLPLTVLWIQLPKIFPVKTYLVTTTWIFQITEDNCSITETAFFGKYVTHLKKNCLSLVVVAGSLVMSINVLKCMIFRLNPFIYEFIVPSWRSWDHIKKSIH